ncbi:hypothetical protein SASPL_127158 [Salvia splendens]|uniref:Uncharacterized protein n=1 Tax=Salvia splendens TaxID=180675 RepID=A0A8X8XN49_SALSN|nr:hypothetical protein SASPL_127158 [Salvia splendens]
MDEAPKKFPISMISSSEESSDLEWEDELMVVDSYEGDSDGDDKDDGSSKNRRKVESPAKTNQDDKDKDKDKDVGSSKKRREIESLAKQNQDDKDKDVGSSKKRKIVSPAKTNQDDKDVRSSKKRRKIVSLAKKNQDDKEKDVGSSSKKILSQAKTNQDDKDKDKDDGSSSKMIVSPANPDGYPRLASFLRQNHMEEALQRNWTVIGNENASKLQQQWMPRLSWISYKIFWMLLTPKLICFFLIFINNLLHEFNLLIILVLVFSSVFDFMKVLYLINCVVCRLVFIIVAFKQLKGFLEIVHITRHDKKAFAAISVY